MDHHDTEKKGGGVFFVRKLLNSAVGQLVGTQLISHSSIHNRDEHNCFARTCLKLWKVSWGVCDGGFLKAPGTLIHSEPCFFFFIDWLLCQEITIFLAYAHSLGCIIRDSSLSLVESRELFLITLLRVGVRTLV